MVDYWYRYPSMQTRGKNSKGLRYQHLVLLQLVGNESSVHALRNQQCAASLCSKLVIIETFNDRYDIPGINK